METRNQNQTKKCEICGRELPISDFSKSYRNRCKVCVAEQVREQRKNGKMVTSSVNWEQRDYAAKAIKAARNFIEVCKKGGQG